MFFEVLLVGFSAVFLFAVGAVLAATASAFGVDDRTLRRWIDFLGAAIERVGFV